MRAYLAIYLLLSGLCALVCIASVCEATYFQEYYKMREDLPTPIVTNIYPPEGHILGRTPVSIWGANFRYSAQLKCGWVEWAPNDAWRGPLRTTPANYIHSSLITCMSPYDDPATASVNEGFGYGDTPCPVASTTKCTVRVMVTNGGDWSAFPNDFHTGTSVTFTWYNSEPSGVFWVSNTTTGNPNLVKGPDQGGTRITIMVDTSGTPTGYNFYKSDMLRCKFPGATDWVQAKFAGYFDENKKVSMIRCTSPPALGSPLTGDLIVSNTAGAGQTVVVGSNGANIQFQYVPPDGHDTNVPADWVASANLPPMNLVPPVRGPLFGKTDVTMKGKNLFPTNNAYCAFIDPQFVCDQNNNNCPGKELGWKCCIDYIGPRCCKKSKAFFISETQYRCTSPAHTGIPTSVYNPPSNPAFSIANYIAAPGFKAVIKLSLVDTNPSSTDLVMLKYYPKASSGLGEFWYTDIYVSNDGNDYTGLGTANSPFRTIQHAANQALFNEPSSCQVPYDGRQFGWGTQGEMGSDRHFNRDQIILMPGIYRGVGNRDVNPFGKLLDITSLNDDATNPFHTTVDCEDKGTFILQGSQRYWDNYDGRDKESITVRNINIVRCNSLRVYSMYNPYTKSNIPYHNPYKNLGAVAIEPRKYTNRPGLSNPGVPTQAPP